MMNNSMQSLIYGLIVILVVVGLCALSSYIKLKLKQFSKKDDSESVKNKRNKKV